MPMFLLSMASRALRHLNQHTLPAHINHPLHTPSTLVTWDSTFFALKFAFVRTPLPSLNLFFLSFLPIFIHVSKTLFILQKIAISDGFELFQRSPLEISFLPFEEYIFCVAMVIKEPLPHCFKVVFKVFMFIKLYYQLVMEKWCFLSLVPRSLENSA